MQISTVTVGMNGDVWLVDSDPANPGVRGYTGNGRFPAFGGRVMKQLSVANAGLLFGLDAQGVIALFPTAGARVPIGGPMGCLSVGTDKVLWGAGGGQLFRLPPGGSFEQIPTPGYAIWVASHDANSVWLCSGSDIPYGRIYRRSGANWIDTDAPMGAHGLFKGTDGSIWIVADTGQMYRYVADGNWVAGPNVGSGMQIAVISQDEIWYCDFSGNVTRLFQGQAYPVSITVERRLPNGGVVGPSVAVDGTLFMGGWARYNGMGGWFANAAPGVENTARFAAYDSNNIWYSDGTATYFYGGVLWADGDRRPAPQPLVNFVYAPYIDSTDALWGCDAQNTVYFCPMTESVFRPYPGGFKARQMLNNIYYVGIDGNIQSLRGSAPPSLGQPFLSVSASSTVFGQWDTTIWAVGADTQLYWWRSSAHSWSPGNWTKVSSLPLIAAAGTVTTAWGITQPEPGTRENDLFPFQV